MSNALVRPTAALEKVMAGEELTFNEGVDLLKNENLFLLGNAANQLRKEIRGDNVSFVSSYYLNYTNVCAASCQLCAFYRKEKDDDAYTLSNEQIVKRAEFALHDLGATELHIVGGFNPKLGLEYYEDMFKSIKNRFPKVIIKALTPAEIFFISRVTKNSIKEVLERLKYAGLDALPGGGAEIFSKHTRDKIVLGKCSGEEWLDTAYQAHKIGLRGNCTMLFGHIETPEDIVDHIIKLRELNKKTGGFTTFIPLKFSLENTQLEKEHTLASESPSIYDLRIIAISRILLGNVLKNVSVYWIALGKKLAQVALCYGGNDLVGTAFSEEIFKAAGKPNQISINELNFLIREIKRNPVQRDTFFNIIK
ncbi:MAG: radical SAM protein [Nitrososphaerales archaeon]